MVIEQAQLPYEPTFADLVKDLWRAKIYLLVGAVVGLALALCFLNVAVPHYRASMLIAPADRQTGPDIKALLPDNSSFAVQYLVNTIGSPDSGDFIRFEHILRAPSVAARLLDDEIILDGYKRAYAYKFQSGNSSDVTAIKLADYFKKSVAIESVGTTPLRRLVVQHPDKEFAVYLLRRLHEEADDIIRAEIRGKTKSRSAYLQEALKETIHPDHRRALASLLMEQEHVRMILAMDESFAAIIAEPPFASVKPYWPRKSVTLPIGILVGMLLGYVLYSLRRAVRS